MNFFSKKIVALSIGATLVSSTPVFASTLTEKQTSGQVGTGIYLTTNPGIQTLQVKGIKSLATKISNSLTITDSQVIFDEIKAADEGLSSEQIQKLKDVYSKMNQMVKDKTLSIKKNNAGVYDISVNEKTKELAKNELTGSVYKSSDTFTPNAVVTKRYYGYDFYFSPAECSDAGAYLAGGGAAAGTLAGILGVTGAGIPLTVVSIIAAGALGLGSAYFWYCSNHGGLDASIVYGVPAFHAHN
ncbi:MAG: hypothetical protein LKE46_13470 [Clostridium sp.]|jgi:hypothetical protein|uniref:hypothetical protein n=1 Tax=Clostridium sp. TaxID=1506 RepID=UPI0025B8E48B|nr:hypothetical protein [Clostridium sp.]MCH3965268.1 hypothetical protein [Clostridium sp.]MCI1714488.1 hypothetical protein [Clostridium sp.]MCI1798750.1 hypothetical protein [Clostridium sp.]MCI1812519.1 hypothetical protein [Clostridium sp.]MCI1869560.1 hypothetical protein [Clostridium sp.]